MDERADTPPADDPAAERPRGNAVDGLAGALGRAAPVLRQVIGDSAAEEMRDAVVARAEGLLDRAHDAVARFTAIEGTVVDGEPGASEPSSGMGTPTDPADRPAPATNAAWSGAATPRDPHWTAQRIARMAAAAGREALRPTPRPDARRPMLLAAGAALVALVLLLLRRRR